MLCSGLLDAIPFHSILPLSLSRLLASGFGVIGEMVQDGIAWHGMAWHGTAWYSLSSRLSALGSRIDKRSKQFVYFVC